MIRPALLLVALLALPAVLRAEDITIQGTSVAVDMQSAKCEWQAPESVSVKRLADCDSATLITIEKTGARLVRFQIDPADPSISEGQRAELRDMYEAVNGEEVWYRFRTLLPTGYPFADGVRVVTAQWHERMPDGGAHKRPPLAHRIVGKGFLVTLWNDPAFDATEGKGDGVIVLNEPSIETGIVHDYVYRILWRTDGGGIVSGWRRTATCDAEQLACTPGPWESHVTYKGPVGFAEAAGYYFKIGLYTTHHFPEPLVVYHAGYLRGPDAASVDATDPIFAGG